jgi:hypothetical protein
VLIMAWPFGCLWFITLPLAVSYLVEFESARRHLDLGCCTLPLACCCEPHEAVEHVE